eukprot:TRINITY_DN31923_c0_g1_i2.p1 TRINITY_DN31923_c0_g1~~TRINITY_DN31923_c0_g1_i2.p1  ORF type:complete len:149 (+),score=35.19 TRINITY_DN31923_c0_g1_i2:105-551(+)
MSSKIAEKVVADLQRRKQSHEASIASLRDQLAELPKASVESDEKAFWRYAIEQDWHTFQLAPDAVRSDEELVLAAVKRSGGEALEHAVSTLRADHTFLRRALEASSGRCLEHAAPEVRQDMLLLGQGCEVSFHLDLSVNETRSLCISQ